MRSIDALDAASGVRLAGILDAEPVGEGFRLRRLPAWTRQQILDPSLRFVATMPSGARIEMMSDTTVIEVDVLLGMLQYGDQERRPAVFDLVINGELHAHQTFNEGRVIRFDLLTQAVSVERGPAVTIRFEGLPPGNKQIQLWLAQGASFELRGLRVDDDAEVSPPTPPPGPRWVHYGSSISHCLEANHPTGTWPAVAARLAGADLISLGLAGQCHLDQFVARTIRDLDVDLISLKLGINVVNGDTMRERVFLSAAQGFIDTVRDGHPATPIAVVTPIICPVAEDHPGPTLSTPGGRVFVKDRPVDMSLGALSLVRIRQLLAEVVTARRHNGDANVHLVDGLALFGAEDIEDLPDGLHPNAAGYQRMGERFHRLAWGPDGVFAAPT
jgi:lysophospholipase L1-like esterase